MAKARTSAQRAALRKAQLASARKRRLRTGGGHDYGPIKHWAADDRRVHYDGVKRRKAKAAKKANRKAKRKALIHKFLGRR